MAERRARKRLWGVYRNHFTDDPSVANVDRGAANTHIYWHGGKMLVLKEDALPYHIDPHSLETLGRWDFHGKWTATSMSAHPKIDPLTGEMIAYGYQAKGDLSDDIAVYTVNPQGHIVKEVWLKSPYLGIIHDIAITQKYILIPVIARTTSLERLKSGEPMWEWNGDLPTMVGVLPRDGDAKDVRWFKGPSRNTLHFLNASDGDNKITMELPVSDGERTPSQIKRWTFDLNTKSDAFERRGRLELRTACSRAWTIAICRCRTVTATSATTMPSGRTTRRPAATARGASRTATSVSTSRIPRRRRARSSSADVRACRSAASCRAKAARAEGDGYLMGVASNYAEMHPSCTSSTRSAWKRARSPS